MSYFDERDATDVILGTNLPTAKPSMAEEKLKNILYWFDEFADSDEARMGLVELIEACGGEVPSEICTSCGSDEARYTSHYNNNAECN